MSEKTVSHRRGSRAQSSAPAAQGQGFYARGFHPDDLHDLGDEVNPGLQDEISMMRVIIRRVFETALQEASDLRGWSLALSTLGQAASRVAALVRADRLLAGSSANVASALSQAINEVLKEMRA